MLYFVINFKHLANTILDILRLWKKFILVIFVLTILTRGLLQFKVFYSIFFFHKQTYHCITYCNCIT